MLAEFYRAAGEPERAERLRDQVQSEAPDTAQAWYLRSFATLDLDEALRCARQAVALDKAHLLAWNRLSHLCLMIDDLEGALRGADRLISLSPEPTAWIMFKGHVLVRQGRIQEGIEQYSRAGAGGRLHRAHAYRRAGEYEMSVADYTWCIQQEGDATLNVWYLYQRATPLWILGRSDEAIKDYQQVRTLLGRPFYADARRVLILRQQGRDVDAEEVLRTALSDVKKPSWLYQIFRCLAGELTPDQLVADGVARNNVELLCEAYYYAGEVHRMAGRFAEARDCFERCVQTGVEFDPDTEVSTPMNEHELAQWRLRTQPWTDH